jgi:osmotically-inducible protein OsmY
VAVVATGSEVRLTGAVESMAARRRAGEVARAMPGVTSVDNRVGVRRGTARTTTPTPRL